MAALGEVFGKELTSANLELYWELLEDVTIEVVEQNAYKHMRHAIFFPKPIELRSEGGVLSANYHQLYTPPWKEEDRWKALPKGGGKGVLHGRQDTEGNGSGED